MADCRVLRLLYGVASRPRMKYEWHRPNLLREVQPQTHFEVDALRNPSINPNLAQLPTSPP